MRQKDYYKILGVSRNASRKNIRDAFRRLAKKYHPDKAGPGAKHRFQDVQEAYEVLSNPQKRRAYDRQVSSRRRRFHDGSASIYDTTFGQNSIFQEFFHRKPYFDREAAYVSQMHRQWSSNPDLVLTLTAEEAEIGGRVELEVPYYRTCPQCGGSGEFWFFSCSACMGHGLLRGRRRLSINIPAGVEDGSVLEVPIKASGLLRPFIKVLIEVRK